MRSQAPLQHWEETNKQEQTENKKKKPKENSSRHNMRKDSL